MNERPLERLNYYNGQRLQAADYRLEQEYHMRVRRWLNRSLFGAGIAEGLHAVKVPKAPKVRISPGLALDAMGREIILLEEREEVVPGTHDPDNRPIALYLTIRYAEKTLAKQDVACILGGGSGEKAPWGGPARLLAEPVLEWSDELPHEDSGKVLLAYVGLGQGCKEVSLLDLGIREYVRGASASRIKQYALEGFRDIDENNEGLIRFHIRGRQPSSVSLILRGDKFPTYFYSELGRHKHAFTPSQGTTQGADPAVSSSHSHANGSLSATSTNSNHGHSLSTRWDGREPIVTNRAIAIVNDFDGGSSDLLGAVAGSIGGGSHSHGISGSTGSSNVTHHHTHRFTAPGQIEYFGADVDAESDHDSLTYVDALQLSLRVDSRVIPLTTSVLTQLGNLSPAWSGKTLGDSSALHIFVTDGTPGIRLDLLPDVSISEGEYEIVLGAKASTKVARNGGRIYYNLYIE